MASDLALAVDRYLNNWGSLLGILQALNRSTSSADSEAFIKAARDLVDPPADCRTWSMRYRRLCEEFNKKKTEF